MTREKIIELLCEIATDRAERTTERLKAIEMLEKIGADDCEPLEIIDDIVP